MERRVYIIMKKRKTLIKIVVLSLCLIMLTCTFVSAASTPYSTYTYTMDGETRESPAAYVPDRAITNYDMNMETALKSPKDIFVDPKNYIYIVDTGNSRVVVCNESCTYQFEITTFNNENGVPDKLNGPEGVFVNEEEIFVCDTLNARIVVFDTEGNFRRIIYAPKADIMGDDTLFRPVSVAVDASGRMYVVSKSTYSGVFAFNDDGTFQGFIGVQKTSVPLAVRIRRFFFPDTTTITYISIEFNNLAIDSNGFVWVTTNGIEDATLESAIHSNDTDYAPIKQLNPQGNDIMQRNGFFMPCGEVNFMSAAVKSSTRVQGPSSIIDIALGPNGVYSVVDSKRARIYTYDYNGQLIYAFGDTGSQLGNLKDPTAITYFNSDIYVLDGTANSITVYKRTEYGDAIDQAEQYLISLDYDKAIDSWKEILKRNNNFDAAYVGIADSMYLSERYEDAMAYYQAAGDVDGYSKCFKELRQQWIEKYLFLALLIVAAIIVGLVFLFRYIGKVNKAGVAKSGKRKFKEEVFFGFYLIMHPFDGFWDLKHEGRGSVRGGIFITALATLAVIYKNVGTAYVFNPNSSLNGIWSGVATVWVPLLLYVVANWCITTLFDGEGTFKDIFMAASYSLVPLIIFLIPTTIFSNVAILDEQAIITLFDTIAYIWLGGLLFFGTMTVHGYSMGKNIIVTLGTVLGMAFIMFLLALFTNLIRRMVSFITDIITEISYRAD